MIDVRLAYSRNAHSEFFRRDNDCDAPDSGLRGSQSNGQDALGLWLWPILDGEIFVSRNSNRISGPSPEGEGEVNTHHTPWRAWRGRMLALILACILAVSLTGCATSCDQLKIKRSPHPSLPSPAATITWRCGKKSVKVEVEKAPACMEDCFGSD